MRSATDISVWHRARSQAGSWPISWRVETPASMSGRSPYRDLLDRSDNKRVEKSTELRGGCPSKCKIEIPSGYRNVANHRLESATAPRARRAWSGALAVRIAD